MYAYGLKCSNQNKIAIHACITTCITQCMQNAELLRTRFGVAAQAGRELAVCRAACAVLWWSCGGGYLFPGAPFAICLLTVGSSRIGIILF